MCSFRSNSFGKGKDIFSSGYGLNSELMWVLALEGRKTLKDISEFKTSLKMDYSSRYRDRIIKMEYITLKVHH